MADHTIAHYQILEKLGEGGMGIVYKARDTRLDRFVAIKVLSPEKVADASRKARFVQEAKAASALNHPNIITIHEIGEISGAHFIATEFIEGRTLRQQMAGARMTLPAALDVAMQVAGALAAAHTAGIVHRDIKPENIMVRPDGLVKVLDFGLAKLTERRTATTGTEAPTRAGKTEPGMVLGTLTYMSPEQARALEVDARSDIFSLGSVFYEMITGRPLFEGETASDVIAAILKTEPLPLAQYSPSVPHGLEEIVGKMLRKNREERYQEIRDMLLDLKELKQELELAEKLGRSIQPDARSRAITEGAAKKGDQPEAETMTAHAAPTAEDRTVHASSSFKRAIGKASSHKLGAALMLAAIGIAAVATFVYLNRPSALTDKDTILLTEFDNKTGDAVFDGTLRQGLAVQLQQSPFLNLIPDSRVRQTLRLMGRSADEQVTREVGREICQRQGLKALIAGSIAKFDRNYSLTLEALNSQTGETIGLTQVEAEGKDRVLKALSQAATELRKKLGESLGSIQKFDAPLEVTTSSLEALRAYSLGFEQTQGGKYHAAIPFYKRAVELDPSFAYAYGALAVQYYNTGEPRLAAEHAEKAFALRERVTELEKLRIAFLYYINVTGELDQAIEVLELYKSTYPRDWRATVNLSACYVLIGQFEKGSEEARQSIRLNPNGAPGHGNLGETLTALNRFAEARETCEKALQQKLDNTIIHTFLYCIGFVDGDTAAMQQQLEWASGKPDEHESFGWQAAAAVFAGEWRRSRDFVHRAMDLAVHNGAKEAAARHAVEQALRAAIIGQFAPAKELIAQSLAHARNQVTLPRATLALALCGEASQAKPLADELVSRYPKNTLINGLWLPMIRAVLQLQVGNARQALGSLLPALRYEAGAEFWPQYVRGQAHLKLNQYTEAAAEFQKILNHRGQAPLSVLYPLAHLGLARAAAPAGDTATGRKAYRDFLALWKNADADLPILVEAKKALGGIAKS